MVTQIVIAEKIKSRKGEYVLAVKENQKTLFEDSEHLKKITVVHTSENTIRRIVLTG